MALFLGEHSIDLFAGQPVHSDVVLSSLYVTPSPTAQTFTPSIEIDGWDNVEVSAIPEEYIIPTGIISITTNGTHNVKDYASASVQIPKIVNLQNKSITPTESSQTVTADSGYDGLGEVSVGAISTTYVGTGIARKSSTDLTVSGGTITAPAGYYENAANQSVAAMTLPTAAAASATSGYTSKATISRSTSDQYINIPTGYNSTGAYYKINAVANGTAGTPSASKGTVSNHSITITPSVTNTTGYITGGTKTGTGVVVSANELVSGTLSITENETAIDVTNYAAVDVAVPANIPIIDSLTVTPTENEQTFNSTSVDGYKPVIVEAISSTYVGSGITRRSSTDLTVSGATVSVPAGYYSAAASKSVASGTAGTPTASKGTVSNHSISITPSVTNTTGWITGSTKTGTAVTVSASELVSGSETKTSNGTYDVTNLAELIINVPTGTGSVVVSDEANATGTTAVVSADDVTTLITKSIIQNGTYNASSDSADGYSSVTVNVSGGSPSATQHEIHLEFSDSTDTDIAVYYNDALISAMITAYAPNIWTYSSKQVILAQLDDTTWYEYTVIPLNTELVDYTKVTADHDLNDHGEVKEAQWYGVTDYTPINSEMVFSYKANMWGYTCFYDSSKTFLSGFQPYTRGESADPGDSNVAVGTLGGTGITIPSTAAYIRLGTVASPNNTVCSLIRTA